MAFQERNPENKRMLQRLNLKTRVNLIIAAILVLIVAIGSLLVIRHVRDSVEQETRSALQMATEMVEAGRLMGPLPERQSQSWIGMLEQLSGLRHVRLYVLRDGRHHPPASPESIEGVPEWFAALVRPPAMRIEERVPAASGEWLRVILVADPGDEIAEAWEETRVFLGLILLLAGGCFVAISWVTGRAFQPVDEVMEGLLALEKGHYGHRLPEFPQPEWNRIAVAFNHCAGVLEQARKDNRNLTRQLLKVEEEERRALARELHDELGQVLSAIKMMALSIKRQNPPEPSIRAACLITDHVDHLFDVIRSMIHKLRPLMLDDLGLAAAIETLVKNWEAHHPEVRIHLHCQQGIDDFPQERQIHVYRIVQESLTNVFRHASASRIELRLETVARKSSTASWLKVSTRDDGRGAAPDARTGLGLKGMRERVESLGGVFRVETAPGKGFHLSILIPYEEEHADAHPRHACG